MSLEEKKHFTGGCAGLIYCICAPNSIQTAAGPLSSAPGPFPWTAALLADGIYVCGSSIIHQQFVMTSVFCAQKLLR